jgi:hypothetical protein
MARGESNILYQPQKIKKRKSASSLLRHGSFPFAVNNISLASFGAIMQGADGRSILFDEKMQRLGNPLAADLIFASKEVSVASKKFPSAVHTFSEFFVHDFSDGSEYSGFFSGDPRGMFVAGKRLFSFCRQEETMVLWEADLEKSNEAEEVMRFPEDTWVTMQDKGEGTFLIYKEDEDEYLISLTEEGVSSPRLLLSGTFKDTPDPRLMAFAGDDEYFALEHGEHGDELTCISWEGESVNRERLITFVGRGKDLVWKDMAVSEGRGVLLGERSLVLFSRAGKEQEIELEETAKGWNRVSFSGQRVILWREGGFSYLEVNLDALETA